jgi:hypothetical protein
VTDVLTPPPSVTLAELHRSDLSSIDRETFDVLAAEYASAGELRPVHQLDADERRVLSEWHAFAGSSGVELPPCAGGWWRPRTTRAAHRSFIFGHRPVNRSVFANAAELAVSACREALAGIPAGSRLAKLLDDAPTPSASRRAETAKAGGSVLRSLASVAHSHAPPVRSHTMT